jgi:hypothetical protein
MDFLKSIIPDDWYLRFFPPEEDSQPGVQLYLHIREGKYIIPVAQGISRSRVVEFLKDINSDSSLDQEQEDGNTPSSNPETDIKLGKSDTNDVVGLSAELGQQMGELFAIPPKTISQIIIDTFNGAEILFVGGGEIIVEHEKDTATGMWQTWFSKTIKQEQRRVACINTNKLIKW